MPFLFEILIQYIQVKKESQLIFTYIKTHISHLYKGLQIKNKLALVLNENKIIDNMKISLSNGLIKQYD